MTHLILKLMKARITVLGVAGSVVLAVAILARWRYQARWSARARAAANAALWAALLVVGALTAVDALANIKWPKPWDFPSFYSVALAAARGLPFYDRQVLTTIQQELARTSGVPSDWLNEVGYWYLPPSVFILWPLGWLSFKAALALHYAVQAAFLAGSAWLIQRAMRIDNRPSGWASTLLLMLLFRPVQSTISLAQIVFGCLFFLLLSEELLERSGVVAGVSLAAGFFFKHLLVIPAGLMAVSRDRRARLAGWSALVTVAVALLASMAVLGRGIFSAYAANGPGARSPELTVDPVVQSLLAMLYRALGVMPHGSLLGIIAFPPFLIAAAILTLATLVLAWRSPDSERRLRGWLLLCLALLCYPNTLFNTLALLFPVILAIHVTLLARGRPFAWGAGLVAVSYTVAGLLPKQTGWITLLCWGACAMLLASARRASVPVATSVVRSD
jgi:hypothetical protein